MHPLAMRDWFATPGNRRNAEWWHIWTARGEALLAEIDG